MDLQDLQTNISRAMEEIGSRENMSEIISPGRDSSSPPPPCTSSVIFLFLKLFSEAMNEENQKQEFDLEMGREREKDEVMEEKRRVR